MRTICLFLAVAVGPVVMAGEPEPRLKLLATLEGASPHKYIPIAFSPDGKLLACADSVTKENVPVVGSVRLWDVGKRKVVTTLRDGGGDFDYGIYSVAYSPDGKTLAASSGRAVTLFDAVSGKEKTSFKGSGGPVAFSPDGKTLAAGDTNGTTYLWRIGG